MQMYGCDLLLFSYLCKVLDNSVNYQPYKAVLWFAFIFVSLQSLRQQLILCLCQRYSCDLLLFSYLCKVLDNYIKNRLLFSKLWFAFIFVSLQSLRQHSNVPISLSPCCDLLLFSYLCKVLDNYAPLNIASIPVVICFYFRIFAKS